MEPVTREELREYAPHGRQEYIDALVKGWPMLAREGIGTPLVWAHFVAQAAAETGGFRIVCENMNYTTVTRLQAVWPSRFGGVAGAAKARLLVKNPEGLANSVYGGRLGNVEKGDGYRYRGRGFNQMTGRAGYREFGRMMGLPLEDEPELLEDPDISLRLFVLYWQQHRCTSFAARNRLTAVGNAINRGNPYSKYNPINATDREAWFERAWLQWGASADLPVIADLGLGDRGEEVQALQQRLHNLNRPCGAVDGIFGADTARAVVAFKFDWLRNHDQPLEAAELVGPYTRSALSQSQPVRRPDREEVTVADLAAAGSRTAKSGSQGMQIAGGVTAATMLQTVSRPGGELEQAKGLAEHAGEWRGVAETGISLLQWLGHNWSWALIIGVAVISWRLHRAGVLARLDDYINGRNMGR